MGHDLFNTIADDVSASGRQSLWLSIVAGVLVAVFGFSLSMAFRRRWRLKGDAIAFFVLMLALMTPAFLVGLGNQLLWKFMGYTPNLWYTALGANVIWGIPFAFLVMLAVWNRYDRHIEEAARDLGANGPTTFREVTLPLVWTRIFGSFLFGFAHLERLRPHDPPPERLRGPAAADPDRHTGRRAGRSCRTSTRSGAGTTAITLALIFVVLIAVTLRLRLRGAPVHSVEEEFGGESGGGIRVETPDSTARGSRAPGPARGPSRRPGATTPREATAARSRPRSRRTSPSTPSCPLMCSMIRSCIASTAGRPLTSGWMVIVKTA